ncbi:uncharacterized protein B0H64DRAFT_108436 [Chaetomium fimeti]|uniref:Uncharacterized protein n=1 Tax=Chaetomium fimeti TaxID=1854472 RepID=A0AAE0LTA8_9PEZI|nr:hypothetical protein B0H64DRAFT_108436 [Chaetomium fimeti]
MREITITSTSTHHSNNMTMRGAGNAMDTNRVLHTMGEVEMSRGCSVKGRKIPSSHCYQKKRKLQRDIIYRHCLVAIFRPKPSNREHRKQPSEQGNPKCAPSLPRYPFTVTPSPPPSFYSSFLSPSPLASSSASSSASSFPFSFSSSFSSPLASPFPFASFASNSDFVSPSTSAFDTPSPSFPSPPAPPSSPTTPSTTSLTTSTVLSGPPVCAASTFPALSTTKTPRAVPRGAFCRPTAAISVAPGSHSSG